MLEKTELLASLYMYIKNLQFGFADCFTNGNICLLLDLDIRPSPFLTTTEGH